MLDIIIRKHTQKKHNKTWALLQTTGGKTNRTSFSCGNRNGHYNTELRTEGWPTWTPPKHRGWTQLLAKGMQFLLLVRLSSLPIYTVKICKYWTLQEDVSFVLKTIETDGFFSIYNFWYFQLYSTIAMGATSHRNRYGTFLNQSQIKKIKKLLKFSFIWYN